MVIFNKYIIFIKVGSGRVSIVIVDVSVTDAGCVCLHIVGLGTQKLAELSSDINNYYKKVH